MKTIFGLILVAVELLRPKREDQPAGSPSTGLSPRFQPALVRWMRIAEKTMVALFAALTVPLIELWSHAMANAYARDFDDRCGALAMANFAANSLRGVLVLTGLFWAVSAFLRWGTQLLVGLAAIWVLWLLIGFVAFSMTVAFAQLYVEHLPVHLPVPTDDYRKACRELITGPKSSADQWLEQKLFPKGPVGRPFQQ